MKTVTKRTRKTYGNTWWGKKWIEALERIDSNRLARGKTYANTGKVQNIKISQGSLKARVQGSWASYYDININLTSFLRDEKKKIKEIIKENSSIAIELEMGKLPEKFLDLLEEENINLLPKKWKDLSATCSCPDYANPCKHLAAVYYMLANEIDKDPFILFDLKEFKKEDLQKAAGLTTDEATALTAKKSILDKFIPVENIEKTTKAINPEEFDFNFPKFDYNIYLKLLTDDNSFYLEGNFKEFLAELYEKVSNKIDDLFEDIEETKLNNESDFYIQYKKYPYKKNIIFPYFSIVSDKFDNDLIKEDLDPVVQNIALKTNFLPLAFQDAPFKEGKNSIIANDKKTNLYKAKKLKCIELGVLYGPEYFFNLVYNIDYDQASDSFKFLNIIASTASALVKANQYIPEVVFEKELAKPDLKTNFENFSIRYTPYLFENKVKEQIKKIEDIMPENLCSYNDKVLSKEGVFDILSLFITHIINRAFYEEAIDLDSKLIRAFLYNEPFKASKFNEKSIGKSLENWLNKLSISKKEISSIIRIEVLPSIEEEIEAELFKLFVDVTKKNAHFENQVPYKKLFEDDVDKKSKGKKAKQVEETSGKKQLFGLALETVKTESSKQLITAGEYIPQVKEIVDSKGEEAPILNLEEMSDVLLNTKEILNLLGIEITIPKELKKLAYPQLQFKAKAKKATSDISYLSMHELLDFSYEISIGDTKISAAEFKRLVKSKENLVKYKDNYLLLNPDEVNNIMNKLKEPTPELSSPMQALYAVVTEEVNGIKFKPDNKIKNILKDLTKIEEITVPKTLNAKLREYQERGFKWLYSNTKKGLGCCIADDMGLGKTIQIITLLLKNKEEGTLTKPALVICPTTLIGNWKKELEKFAPSLNVALYHGSERQFNPKGKDIIISSYGILRRDLKKFQSEDWSYLIIDEAQNIKNAETDQTKAVKSIKANAYIAMTGTPVENKLTELWNIFDFSNKGYLGGISSFKRNFSTPIEKYKDEESIKKFKTATAPFMIRRLKTDKAIINDLPDKITFDEYCYLSKEQAAIYENIVKNTISTIEGCQGIERKGLIFKLITDLKQVCNHPVNYSKKGTISPELSGKSQKTIKILEKILANKEKSLIFTQYREMGDLLVEMIEQEFKTDVLFFHGGIQRKKRDEMVDKFQNDLKNKIMIVSLKAGGTGLNLTAASNVIHYDLWWNPAVENQATDRVYRIGQEKKVLVHRLITLGTFEEKIDEIIKSKKELADLTVSTGEKWITEMSNSDLREIFTLHNS